MLRSRNPPDDDPVATLIRSSPTAAYWPWPFGFLGTGVVTLKPARRPLSSQVAVIPLIKTTGSHRTLATLSVPPTNHWTDPWRPPPYRHDSPRPATPRHDSVCCLSSSSFFLKASAPAGPDVDTTVIRDRLLSSCSSAPVTQKIRRGHCQSRACLPSHPIVNLTLLHSSIAPVSTLFPSSADPLPLTRIVGSCLHTPPPSPRRNP